MGGRNNNKKYEKTFRLWIECEPNYIQKRVPKLATKRSYAKKVVDFTRDVTENAYLSVILMSGAAFFDKISWDFVDNIEKLVV